MLPLMPPGGAPPGAPPAPMPPDPSMASIGGPVPGMGPIPLPPPPAALAGQAAMSLVPQQTAEQEAQHQERVAQTLAFLLSAMGNQPNPVAEAAQGMPAQQVSPDSGVVAQDQSMTAGGY